MVDEGRLWAEDLERGEFSKVVNERDALRVQLKNAEEVIHAIGEVSGMLDVCGARDVGQLVELCQECRKRLEKMDNDYWKTKEEN